MSEPLLRVRGLCVDYGRPPDGVRAVIDVDFDLDEGEMLGLVGESGCGKSTAAMGMMRVLPPPAVITAGSVRYEGREVLGFSEEQLRRWRWQSISWVPQSALYALNPVLTVGQHVADTLRAHGITGRAEIGRKATELLTLVDLDPVHVDSYPHTLSGGMRQRVGVALALALEPRIVVFDEPTTALDVVVERELLQRVIELQRERGFAILFITHDLHLLLEMAQRVAVMYSGHLVETGPVEVMREGGRHPYTQGLVAAAPSVFGGAKPVSIPGSPPRLEAPPAGCRFHPRCPRVVDSCRVTEPELHPLTPTHHVACHVVEAEG